MIEGTLNDRYLHFHPLPKHQSGDKHSRGRVLVIAGHLDVPGAAVLAGLGALRAGAGVLRIATCRTNAPHIGAAMPEAMVVGCAETSAGEIAVRDAQRLVDLASSSDAVLIGPGMLDEASVGELCSKLLEEVDGPHFILDAAAFTSLRDIELPRSQQGRIVCTPHFGEMAKFLKLDREDVEGIRWAPHAPPPGVFRQ
jgi:ADP-dependent NAD(P)H-hydrate dehydratase